MVGAAARAFKPAIKASMHPVLMSTTRMKVLTAKPAHTAHSDCLRCSNGSLHGKASLAIEDATENAQQEPTGLHRHRKRCYLFCRCRNIGSRCLLPHSVFARVGHFHICLVAVFLLHHEHFPSCWYKRRVPVAFGLSPHADC